MSPLPHLTTLFERLRRGYHVGPDDEPEFSTLCARFDEYASYFGALGLALIRHEREFFYFEPENAETIPETLPRIMTFSYIMIDHAANQGRSIEEYIFGQNFLVAAVPHFTLDRYTALLRQVGVHDVTDLRLVLNNMARIGWLRCLNDDEFRFLRPFHRVFSKCIERAQAARTTSADESSDTTPEAGTRR
jgi:hypothetical protein